VAAEVTDVERVDAVERETHPRIDVCPGLDGLGASECRRAIGVPDDQALGHALRGEPSRDPTTELTGGASDADQAAHHGQWYPGGHLARVTPTVLTDAIRPRCR
jgi:hypothetical protein